MMSTQPIPTKFKVGQVVVATGSYGRRLTPGKQYTVVEVTPVYHKPHFTFPEYTSVIGDDGYKVTGHTYRFRELSLDEVN